MMKFRIIKAITLSCLSVITIGATAQTKKDSTKTAVTEEIEIVRSYKPVLADAVKIRRSPDLNNVKPFNPKISYDFIDKRLELNTGLREIEAQKLAVEMQQEQKTNFAKAALGNLGTSLAQLNIATGQDPALQAAFNFNHLGMSGKLNQQKISQQDINGFGRYIGESLVLQGKLAYNRFGTYFYGQDPNQSFLNPDPDKQKFNTFSGEGTLFNRVDANDETSFTYGAKFGASVFNNGFSAKENNIFLSAGLGKNLNSIKLGVNASLDLTGSKDLNYDIANHFLKANPYIQFETEFLRLTGGLNYISEFGERQRIHIFPIASLDLRLIRNYLTIFGSVNGDVTKNTIRNFSNLNPFINENILLRNTVEKFNIYGGARGTFAANIGFKAMLTYKTLSDLSYFVNDVTTPQKFNVEYFNGNMNVLGFTGELTVRFSDVFNVDGKINLNQYDHQTEPHAWLLPSIDFTATAAFKVTEKVKVTGDVYFQGETKAKIYDQVIVNPPNPLPFTSQTIGSFADISLGTEFLYNKKLSGFLKLNNILGNSYIKYPYYPNYGIGIFGGVTYSF